MQKKVTEGIEMKRFINFAHSLSSNWFQKFHAGIEANQRWRAKHPVLATQSSVFLPEWKIFK